MNRIFIDVVAFFGFWAFELLSCLPVLNAQPAIESEKVDPTRDLVPSFCCCCFPCLFILILIIYFSRKSKRPVSSDFSRDIQAAVENLENSSNETSVETATEKPAISIADEIIKLAQLRERELISDEEFKAFSEGFTKSAGDKANEIIMAIERLHQQHKNGAISDSNYRSSLWNLMDKLDRKI